MTHNKETRQLKYKNRKYGKKYVYTAIHKDGKIKEVINLTKFAEEQEMNITTLYRKVTDMPKEYNGWVILREPIKEKALKLVGERNDII